MRTRRQNDEAFVGDTERAREKPADDWLPVTASRKAKWWYSAFHNVNAIVGVGVLSLPFAMSQLGWGPGIAMLIISLVVTLYTLWQMVQMHEAVPGKRFDRLHELGQHAFGKKLGLWIVVPQQLLVLTSGNIMYMGTGGKSLKNFHDIVCPGCSSQIPTPFFTLILASVNLVLSQLPSLNSISAVSLTAAVMSVSYSTVAWGISLGEERREDVHFGYREHSTGRTVFSFFSALGSVAFAYAGHSVVLEIQATIPSTRENPSKGPMWKGAVTAYIVVALCYFPISVVGYWMFGNGVHENILLNLENRTWVLAMASMMVAIRIIGIYQLYAMTVFDIIESFLTKALDFSPSIILRLVSRSIYVAFTMFAAIVLPDYNGLLDFQGGFSLTPINYFLPCIMWLIIYKPRRYSLSWFTNWICIVLGVLLMILSTIGGLWKIIDKTKPR